MRGDVEDLAARAKRDAHFGLDARIDGRASDVVQRRQLASTPGLVPEHGMVLEMVVAVSDKVVEIQSLQEERAIAKRIARSTGKYRPATTCVITTGWLVFHFGHEKRCLAEVFLVQPSRGGQAADVLIRIIGERAVKATDGKQRFSSIQIQKLPICRVKTASPCCFETQRLIKRLIGKDLLGCFNNMRGGGSRVGKISGSARRALGTIEPRLALSARK